MKRSLRPDMESLEGKNLMTGSADFAYSLKEIPVPSPVGHQYVELALTIANVSGHAESLALSPALDGFHASLNGHPIWTSSPPAETVALGVNKATTIYATFDETPIIKSMTTGSSSTLTFYNDLAPSDTLTNTLHPKKA